MKIVVGGGLGFIGACFTRLLVKRGFTESVIIIDEGTYAADLTRLRGLEGFFTLVSGSIGNESILDEYVTDADFFVNFAAETHNDNSIRLPKRFLETNVVELGTLANFCSRHGIHLHHVSTDEVFGDTELSSSLRFNETSQLNPSSPYSASKAAGELLLKAWHRTYGLKFSISNCSNNFGPNQHSEKLIPTIFRHLRSGNPVPLYGTGENVRDWIHVDDHCEGILRIIERRALGTYIFGASDEVSNLTLVKAIGSHLGINSNLFELVADRPGHDRRYALDWSKSREKLGWEPRQKKILDSMHLLASWY